ncbi:MAG: endonuclease III [Clostridia bacterium]|nr:endonuclease III [Clostridia bacterium]MBQ2720038.1 endonuclease III [Clostridia bacterium]MBQ4628457.1 endonuclease III [Clostridia bacterium]
MKLLTKKEKLEIHKLLLELYPHRRCALEYSTPFELLVASRLSAQCTDVRVNIVTEELFKKYRTPQDFASLTVEELEPMIRSCGLGNTKARDIIAASKKVIELGGIPDTMDGMLSIPGIGRKIANLLLGEIFEQPGVVIVDTHCIRLANRMGFVSEKDPKKIETELRKVIPANESLDFCHAIVFHGRQVCSARNPDCENCPLSGLCKKYL